MAEYYGLGSPARSFGGDQDEDVEHDCEQQLLVEWFRKKRLERHVDAITDARGDFGILSLGELRDLNEGDVADILDRLKMNMGERNRFIRGVRGLQEGSPAPQKLPSWEELEDDRIVQGDPPAAREVGEERPAAPPKAHAPGGGDGAGGKQISRHLRLLQEALEVEAVEGLGGDELSALEQQLNAARSRLDEVRKEQEVPAAGPAPEGGYEFPDDGDAQWFEVVKNLAFVKKAPNKDALGCGLMRKGQLVQVKRERVVGGDGKEWVELTPLQMMSCETEDPFDRGFMLVDGAHLGLGPLLRGPVSRAQPQELQAQQQQRAERFRWGVAGPKTAGEEEEEKDPRLEMQQRYAQEQIYRRTSFLDRLREQAQQWRARRERLKMFADAWIAVHGSVSVRRMEDPAEGEAELIECNPGDTFWGNGNERVDRKGCKWVEQYAEDHSGPRVWMLRESPDAGTLPLMFKEASRPRDVRVAVHYVAVSDDVRVFETFLSQQNSVRLLRQRLCAATGLRAAQTVLMAPGAGGKLPSIDSNRGMMQDEQSLSSHGLQGPEAVVYLSYTGNFEEHYLGGCLSQERGA